ncbi:hypothetical protein IQ231_08755 [Cuspidothrix issatschenkoi LEGE 03284]|jgi:hypothetical protein|uniref:hypothetical protein n=1 Tax=Cuspidothrix issatschenkoi TaxID=230752 RepID=UPI001882380A|nr:hypothetical protein [Cuspidothrix issatschenkoi]MBE9231774.1 hypothetical protein [Cuspidothrix issatschenkoi LEGE 03284]
MLHQSDQSQLLVELSTAEQQLLSGGCYQPRKCCKPYPKYDSCSNGFDRYLESDDDERD